MIFLLGLPPVHSRDRSLVGKAGFWLGLVFAASLSVGLAAPPTSLPGDGYFASGRPWIDVRAYGAVGDGVVDDTVAVQNALNAAIAVYNQRDSNNVVIQRWPITYFPTGKYRITSTLLWTASTLQGESGNSVLIWDGTPGGVLLKNDLAHPFYQQGLTQRGIFDLTFLPSANATPGCYLDLTGYLVDWGGILERSRFGATAAPTDGGVAAAVRVDSIVNGQWSDLRFDDFSGYAISINHVAGSSFRDFCLNGFEARVTTGNPSGFLKVTIGSTSSTLNVDLANGRIESVVPWTNAPAAVVSFAGALSIVQGNVSLRNLALQVGPAGSTVALLDQSPSTLPTAADLQVVIKNVRSVVSTISPVLGGSWGPALAVPPPLTGPIAFWASGRLNSGTTNPTLLQLGAFKVRNDNSVQLQNLASLPMTGVAAGQLAVLNGKLYVHTGLLWVLAGLQNAGTNKASISSISLETTGVNAGAAKFDITGAPGLNIVIQASTDLENWVTLTTDTLSVVTLMYLDATSTSYTRRFYRVVTP